MNEHNCGWKKVNGVYTCLCGATIDMTDPDYPQGIVREPVVTTERLETIELDF